MLWAKLITKSETMKINSVDFLIEGFPLSCRGFQFGGRVGPTTLNVPRGYNRSFFEACEIETSKINIVYFKDAEMDAIYRKKYTVKVVGGELRFEDNKGERVSVKLETQESKVYFRVSNTYDLNGFVDFFPQIANFSVYFATLMDR